MELCSLEEAFKPMYYQGVVEEDYDNDNETGYHNEKYNTQDDTLKEQDKKSNNEKFLSCEMVRFHCENCEECDTLIKKIYENKYKAQLLKDTQDKNLNIICLFFIGFIMWMMFKKY